MLSTPLEHIFKLFYIDFGYLGNAVFLELIFLCSKLRWERISTTQHLKIRFFSITFYNIVLQNIPWTCSDWNFLFLLYCRETISKSIGKNQESKLNPSWIKIMFLKISLSDIQLSYLAILFGISTTSCSEGFNPNIFIAGCKS